MRLRMTLAGGAVAIDLSCLVLGEAGGGSYLEHAGRVVLRSSCPSSRRLLPR